MTVLGVWFDLLYPYVRSSLVLRIHQVLFLNIA